MTKKLNEALVKPAPVQVIESTEGENGTTTFRAIVSEGDYINANNRKYPMHILRAAFEKVNENPAMYPGAVDHPDPWAGVSVRDLGIKWERFDFEGNYVYGTGRTLRTRAGLDLKAAIDEGIAVGFSTRTKADGEAERDPEGKTVFVITTMEPPFVDAVTNPSVGHARVVSYAKESEDDMDKELLEALERQHKAETELAVAKALAEATTTIGILTGERDTAQATIATLTQENEGLKAELAKRDEAALESALDTKLQTLTTGNRFAPTIIDRAKQLGVTVDTAESVVGALTQLIESTLTAANETGGEARGSVDNTSEDAEKPADTRDESELSDIEKMVIEAGLNR